MNALTGILHAELTFGTYRVSGETAARAVMRALEAGVSSVDTARLYRNESSVFGAVRAFEAAHPEAGAIRVCTKIFKNLPFDQTIRAIETSAERPGRARRGAPPSPTPWLDVARIERLRRPRSRKGDWRVQLLADSVESASGALRRGRRWAAVPPSDGPSGRAPPRAGVACAISCSGTISRAKATPSAGVT